jgi:RND family efflux transporter MFP subunit
MDSASRKVRRRRSFGRKILVGGVVACLAAGLTFGISDSFAASQSSFVTATAGIDTVDHTLTVDGTAEPVNDAEAEFQVSGTVAAVDVAVGQKVTTGQTIATLDTATLESDLTEAKTTLEAAEAILTENEEDEAASASNSDSQAVTSSESSGTDDDELTSAVKPQSETSSLSSDQAAIVSDQHAVDVDMQAVAAGLMAVSSECADEGSGSSGSGSGTSTSTSTTTTSLPTTTTTTSPTTTTTTDPTTTTTTTPTTSDGGSSGCEAALTSADQAEQQVSTDQETLATAESALARLLSSMASSSSTGSSSQSKTSKSSTSENTGTSGGSTSKSTTGSGSSSSVDTNTPAQLASDESTIDSDQASVVEAEQSLAEARLVSPIDGTVETVGLTAGGSVSAGSSSDAITIVDWQSYEVNASLTTSQVEAVKVGQTAQITVDGVGGTLEAKVTQVGPASESDSTYVYPVVMTVTSEVGSIPSGSSAQATIQLAEAQDVLVVPTSAVHTAGTSDSYVYVLQKGEEVRRSVKVGLVGTVYTQVTSGLQKGAIVVLADPSEAVPSSSSNSTSFSSTRGRGSFNSGSGGPGGSGAPSGGGFGASG